MAGSSSFTVGLSQLSTNAQTERNYLKTLDTAYGGTPQLALTVPAAGRPKNKYTVAAESAIYHLIPFLGQVLQEPLAPPPRSRPSRRPRSRRAT